MKIRRIRNLFATYYGAFTPESVDVFLRSGDPAMPSPGLLRGPFEVFLPLAVNRVGDKISRVVFVLPPDLRKGLVLHVEGRMEERWLVYGGFPLPLVALSVEAENGVRVVPPPTPKKAFVLPRMDAPAFLHVYSW